MRVVIDTDVFVSGIYWRTESHQILLAWLRGAFDLVLTRPIFAEYCDVAGRLKATGKLSADPSVWLAAAVGRAAWVQPAELVEQIGRDPGDQIFFAAALGGQANIIVARDKHFTDREKPLGIRVLTPRQFMNLIPRQFRRGR